MMVEKLVTRAEPCATVRTGPPAVRSKTATSQPIVRSRFAEEQPAQRTADHQGKGPIVSWASLPSTCLSRSVQFRLDAAGGNDLQRQRSDSSWRNLLIWSGFYGLPACADRSRNRLVTSGDVTMSAIVCDNLFGRSEAAYGVEQPLAIPAGRIESGEQFRNRRHVGKLRDSRFRLATAIALSLPSRTRGRLLPRLSNIAWMCPARKIGQCGGHALCTARGRELCPRPLS